MKSYEGYKYKNGSFSKVSDSIVPEFPLQISLNGEVFTITMQSPGEEINLAVGLLFSEGYLDNKSSFEANAKSSKEGFVTEVDIITKNPVTVSTNKRSLLSVASCGICGQTELNIPEGKVESGIRFDPTNIFDMFVEMQSRQDAFVNTGGSHACALFDSGFNLLTCKEDVGRHNAVDKAVGQLFCRSNLKEAAIMLVSGRVSYEILVKSFKAGIPVLAAVSTPSTMSIDYAKEFGITLIGFCRDSKLTVYSVAERLNGID